MSAVLEQMKSQATLLSPEERLELAKYLLVSVDPADETVVSPGWVAEAKRRLEEHLTGRSAGIPAEQVLAELREEFP